MYSGVYQLDSSMKAMYQEGRAEGWQCTLEKGRTNGRDFLQKILQKKLHQQMQEENVLTRRITVFVKIGSNMVGETILGILCRSQTLAGGV